MKTRKNFGFGFFIFLNILFFVCTSSLAQYNFKTYSTNDGMSSNSVLAIEMDSRGYLWVGTYYGLNRFDGQNFKNYFFEGQYINSRDQVSDIFTDSRGRLWVGTVSNLYLYNEELDEFNRINEHQINIGEIAESPDSTIWVVGYGAFIVDEADLSLKAVKIIGGNNRKIEDILFDRKGRIWLGWFDNGVTMCRYLKTSQGKELYVERIYTMENSRAMKSNIVRELSIDFNNMLWFTTYEGINWIDLNRDEEDLTVESISADFSNSRFWSVVQDQHGKIWAGSYGDGLYIMIQENGQNIINIKTNLQDQRSISCNEIHTIYEDYYGSIWIGTENGLNKLIQGEIEYKTYYNTPDNPNSISSNHVFEIFQDNESKIWTGTAKGLSMLNYNRNDEVFERYYLSDSGYVENFILSLFPGHKKNQFFIGCRDGLYIYELGKNAKRIDKIRHRYDKSILTVRKIVEIGSRLWLATDNGIHIYDYISDELAGYIDFDHQDLDCDDILYDCDKTVWLATNYGLRRIMNPTDEVKNFKIKDFQLNNNDNIKLRTKISTIFQDSDSIIWIGTYEGLFRYNPTSDEYRIFNTLNGLREDFVAGLIENKDNLIVVGLSSITSINKFNFIIESYSFDAAITNERESFYLTRLNDGNIAMGGINGLKILNPETMKKDTTHYPLFIQDFRIGSKSILPAVDKKGDKIQSVSTTNKIYLKSSSNTFSLHFASLYFSDPVRFNYKYRLEGYDDEWMYVNNNQGYANYSKLDPGNYIFKVNATNSAGQWNEQDTILEIVVLPPFWMRWYSILFYFIVFIILIIFIQNELSIRFKLTSTKRAKHEIEKQKSEQMKFFINVSHELKSPLSLIYGPLEHIHRQLDKGNDLHKYSSWALTNAYKLNSIVNSILDLRLLDAGKIKPTFKTVSWKGFVRNIYSYFLQSAKQKEIRYRLQNEIDQIVTIDIQMIEKSIVNLLDNAFKYTPKHSEITLRSFIDKQCLPGKTDGIHIICSNTGSFIEATHLNKIFERFYRADNNLGGSGIGLSVTKRFVKLHKGRIWCESDELNGVTFHIVIPLITAILESDTEIIYSDEKRKKEVNESSKAIQKESSVFLGEANKYTEINSTLNIGNASKISSVVSKTSFDKKDQENRSKILLVEDDFNMREFIKSILSGKYQILLAENGKEAIEIINTRVHPDLIISDIMMPEMDGFTLCDKIKGNNATSHIPIILLTARPEQYSILESYKHEANAYIEKPFKQELLTFCIKSILKQHEILKKYYTTTLIDFHKKGDEDDPNKKFLDSLKNIILENIDNSDLSIETLCQELSISQYMLYNKIKAITGKTPGQIIKTIRTHKAENFLKKGFHSVKEVQYLTGFNSAKSLRDAFKEEFGMLPSEYKEQEWS